MLAAAGLDDASEHALRPLAARVANVDDRIAVARLFVAAGDCHRAQSMLVAAYAEPLARGVATGQEELWRLAWPDAFAAERRQRAAAEAVVDPWFVASIMREESGYRPDAVSVSGALGLLQLMPDTARDSRARRASADFAASQLVQPALNLRLGTLFLDQLTRRFDGCARSRRGELQRGSRRRREVGARLRRRRPTCGSSRSPTRRRAATRSGCLRSLHVYRSLYP